MKKKNLLACLFFFSIIQILLSQKKNLLYAEIGGNAIFYSLNYERLLNENTNSNEKIYVRVGIAFNRNNTANFTFTGMNKSYNIPIMLNYVKGKKHGIEIGGGVLMSFQNGIQKRNRYYPTASIRYLFEHRKGIILKAGWTPILIDTEGLGLAFLFMPGISLGYKF